MTSFGAFLLLFVFVMALVGLIKGLSLLSQWWERRSALAPAASFVRDRVIGWPRDDMSSGDDDDDAEKDFIYHNSAFSARETNSETAETARINAETLSETFTLGEIEALARLVAAGKIGLTEAVKIGADAKSGERYQQRSRAIKARVDELKDKYPQRTPEQEARRQALGLSKS